jgi:hypothetical protein
MHIEVDKLDDETLVSVYKNRNLQSQDLWTTLIKEYKRRRNIWKGQPEWLATVPRKRSHMRDTRVFLATESQINNVISRPVKPDILPANESEDAKVISSDLQDLFLDKYVTLGVKKTFRRALRNMHFSKIFCIKVFWNIATDDFDVKAVDPRKVRFSRNASKEEDTEFSIETIDDKRVLNLIESFPDKEAMILKEMGVTKDEAIRNNPEVVYHEVWIGTGVFWILKDRVILKKQRNPYYDFQGLLLTSGERAEIEEKDKDGKLPRVNGRRRRDLFAKFKSEQAKRKEEHEREEGDGGKYESYLYNHHDKPRKPYIYGTILDTEDSPVGETTYIEIVEPLQEGIDKRKRQIADNADFLNGITKVDTSIVTMTLADARKLHYDAEGVVYGHGVGLGVTRETGTPLPPIVFQDLEHSIRELDNIFGTPAQQRDEKRAESATGRAILREGNIIRLDEVLDLVEFAGSELYNWWFQFIKVKYTESHFTKLIGSEKGLRVLDFMQDDLQEGIEIRIIPGQTLPDDKIFRAERAREDAKDGLIDLVTYLEAAGGYDNPEDVAKKAVMWKANPLSVIEFSDEDVQTMIEANEKLAQITPQAQEEPGADGGEQVAATRERIQAFLESKEFQNLPPDQQEKAEAQIRASLQRLGGAQVEGGELQT